jgi:hypothetical protein
MELPNKTEATSPVKFTQEEVAEVTAIREGYDTAVVALGRLEWQRRELQKAEAKLNDEIVQLESREKQFMDAVVAKYGEGTFDIATGIFTPRKA